MKSSSPFAAGSRGDGVRIPGWKTLVRTARRMRSRLVGGAVILGYHRIADLAEDPYSITVSAGNFAQQLEVIETITRPLPLHEMVSAAQSGKLPARSVCVTFDDGYADLLAGAKPLLIKRQVPATVFVTPGYLGREFWWEKLYRLAVSAPVPHELNLRIGAHSYHWSIQADKPARTMKEVIRRLEVLLEPLSEEERGAVFSQIRDLLGAATAPAGISRSLTADEIIELSRDGMIDIGCHSMTHRSLVGLSAHDQEFEINQSRDRLEAILGRPVMGFSYPNGVVSGEVRTRVQGAGYRYACGSYGDVTCRRSDPFHLPRFWIPDCNGETFERWLRRWLRALPP
jgi:peptidoglycan/xylan/chitin deacetylase (PgdA/CDA1 family)